MIFSKEPDCLHDSRVGGIVGRKSPNIPFQNTPEVKQVSVMQSVDACFDLGPNVVVHGRVRFLGSHREEMSAVRVLLDVQKGEVEQVSSYVLETYFQEAVVPADGINSAVSL